MYYEPQIYKDKPQGSLCWFCKKSAAPRDQRCSWSDAFVPVDGWEVIHNLLSNYKRTDETYCVVRCPEFDFEDWSGRADPYDWIWRNLKHDDSTQVYENIGHLIVTAEV